MTRDEFMQHAEHEIAQALDGQKNRLMNLVQQAWAEGKRNAEIGAVDEVGKELVNVVKEALHFPTVITGDKWLDTTLSDVPDACKICPNHPSNGGSGVCFCIMGTHKLTVKGD